MNKVACLLSVSVSFFVAASFRVAQDQARAKPKVDQRYVEQDGDDKETKLQKERIRAVLEEVKFKQMSANQGVARVFFLFEARQRLLDAQLDFHDKPRDIVNILERNVKIARELESQFKALHDARVEPVDNYLQAKYYRADAELQLLRAKKGFKNVVDTPKKSQGLVNKEAGESETKLLKERIQARLDEVEANAERKRAGVAGASFVVEAQRKLLASQLDFYKKPNKIVSLLATHVENEKANESEQKGQYEKGIKRKDGYVRAKYYRADIELRLLRTKKKYKIEGKK